MKEFAVIGMGNFGEMLVRKLTELGCKVTAVDINKTQVQALQEYADQAILANAADRKFLENLEVSNYDCFIISTGEDSHASILITLYLKELGAKKIIVKANTADHARILYKVGADDVIIPEEDMAVKIAKNLAQPNVLDYLPLSDEYLIAEIIAPSKFIGKTLKTLKLRTEYHLEVIAIKDKAIKKFNFIPHADYEIQQSDVLVVLGKEKNIEDIKE
ncbi:MAG: TrkA family potassium uptake protein [candidate division Zixibacteria bacterium]|nr:TrkA family potassium uptake protein [candidate division Zixibacteria bacterium]